MSELYRVRPANDKTVEEIKNHYLWFSRPTAFNDKNDANVFAFLNKNESIAAAFTRLFKDNIDVAEQSSLAGICCFTDEMPSPSHLAKFPNAKNGIVMVFDRSILENHFLQTYTIGDCFKKIEYLSKPTLFKSSGNDYILWEKKGDDEIYQPINAITSDQKSMDQLFLKMFTRIGSQFQNQKEYRIVLAGSNVPNKEKNLKGYQIQYPKEAIKAIYVHEKAPKNIIEAIKKLGHDIKIVKEPKTKKGGK